MTPRLPRLPLAEIVGRLPGLRDGVRFPAEPIASYPLPRPHAGAPAWEFFFCPWQGFPPEPLTLLPPVARFVVGGGGELLHAAPVAPADYGQSMAPRAPLGVHGYDPPIRMDEYLLFEADLHAALDELFELTMALPPGASAAAMSAVLRWRTAFDRIAQPPLLPFYHATNPAFFAWAEAQVARATSTRVG